jgi:hypothetical protein
MSTVVTKIVSRFTIRLRSVHRHGGACTRLRDNKQNNASNHFRFLVLDCILSRVSFTRKATILSTNANGMGLSSGN